MSQYYPTYLVKDHPVLNRSLYREEYEAVVREMDELGFRNGWIQELDSNVNYNPDFNKKEPFS
jgi:putative pyruvate formate lyase activating enzyme